jgi:hypothetical protein
MSRIILPPTTVYSDSPTTVRRIVASPWFPCSMIEQLMGTFELREIFGPIQVGLGIDVAVVENAPSNGTILIAATTNLGLNYGDFVSIISDTANKRLMRLVWLCSNTSTTNLGFARVGGAVDLQRRG